MRGGAFLEVGESAFRDFVMDVFFGAEMRGLLIGTLLYMFFFYLLLSIRFFNTSA